MVANMLEKTFTSTASLLEVDPSLFNFSKEGEDEPLYILLASTIDATREDLLRSLQARRFQLGQGAQEQPRRLIINRLVSHVSETRITEFQERLTQLLQEFEAEDKASRPADQLYALTVALYPSFHFDPPIEKETKE
jgi:hypothetical protein